MLDVRGLAADLALVLVAHFEEQPGYLVEKQSEPALRLPIKHCRLLHRVDKVVRLPLELVVVGVDVQQSILPNQGLLESLQIHLHVAVELNRRTFDVGVQLLVSQHLVRAGLREDSAQLVRVAVELAQVVQPVFKPEYIVLQALLELADLHAVFDLLHLLLLRIQRGLQGLALGAEVVDLLADVHDQLAPVLQLIAHDFGLHANLLVLVHRNV